MSDFVLSQADARHIPDIAFLHIEGWKSAYQHILSDRFLTQQSTETRVKDWQGWLAAGDAHILIAHHQDRAVGFVGYGRLKTPPPGTSRIRPLFAGEIYALYLLPDVFKCGLGRRLLSAAAQDLKNLYKIDSLCLWVAENNERARGFYEHMGGQKLGKKQDEIGGQKVTETCYGWRQTDILLKT